MLRESTLNGDQANSESSLLSGRLVRSSPLETRSSSNNNQSSFFRDRFERTSGSNNYKYKGASRKSIQVKEEEESSVHRESFSSSSTQTSSNRAIRKSTAAVSSASSESSAAASLSTTRRTNQTGSSISSADLSASSSSSSSRRHVKTSSLFVSNRDDSEQELSPTMVEQTTFQRPAEGELFSSPDVRSLVIEIGTDFAELESALSSKLSFSSSQSSQISGQNRGTSSLSTRLFGRRLLSPTGDQNQQQTSYAAIRNSSSGNLFDETIQVNQTKYKPLSSSIQVANCSELKSKLVTDFEGKSELSRSNGEKIQRLALKAEKFATLKNDEISLKASNDRTIEGEKDKDRCKTVMTVSIERIDQRMSDLCKKLNSCQDTKEAIELLKIMIQMVEKAWSVPVCGDDLGFKLCNSLRAAGGLDIVLGFIQDAEEQTLFAYDNSSKWRPSIASEGASSKEEHSSETTVITVEPARIHQVKNNIGLLKLNLSKLSKTKASSLDEQTNTSASTSDKEHKEKVVTRDSDSDILTSDLGMDSTSIESLSYVSAPTTQASTTETSDELKEDKPNDTKVIQITNETGSKSSSLAEQALEKSADNETEDDLDIESELVQNGDNLDEEEASFRKEELVFLSARLLSQCLTSKNRDYIVENGLQPVIRLACNFTTMKSTQSQRLLSRSISMRQSSSSLNTSSSKLDQESQKTVAKRKVSSSKNLDVQPAPNQPQDEQLSVSGDQSDMHAIIGTEILQHLFKHSEDTCSKIISMKGLQAILYGCRSSNTETLRHCASALANLALYGGRDSQQIMIEQKAHVWLFPLAFNEDDNVQYYACLAIVVLAANQEIEADVLKSSTLDLVEPFVTSHEPQKFAESTTSHIHGQSATWLRKLIPLLESKREEARNLACFHFAMEAHIKKEQDQTQVFKEIGAVEPLKKVGSSPIAIASKFACQALRLIGEKEPHKLSQQVPLWTCEDVMEWISQIGFERFKKAFVESGVDGDLLLQLDEDMLKLDIGIENGIIRRRFLRELSNLKRIADYSSVDKSGLSSVLATTAGNEFIQYIYPLVQLGVTKENLHLLDSEQLLHECKISNTIHRLKLAHTIKNLQERMAVAAASDELSSSDGSDAKTLDVFVSYRRVNGSQLASLLKVHLQLRGFSVFIDVERLEAGKFDNNLLDSIKTARNFILVLSPNALDRCIGDHECKDWVHKEIVAALASNCNIIPIIDNFHWPDPEQLPEDMRSITYFNGVRWIHDYQDACVDKVERFIRGELSCNGSYLQSNSSAQSSLQRIATASGANYSVSTPAIIATPSTANYPSTNSAYSTSSRVLPFDSDYHPLSFAASYNLQHQTTITSATTNSSNATTLK